MQTKTFTIDPADSPGFSRLDLLSLFERLEMKLLITRDEAAALLHVCTRTIDRQILQRGLPARRLGDKVLIRPAELHEWIRDAPAAADLCTARRCRGRLSAINVYKSEE
jgi:excisionase family DNA binding protein